MLGTDGKPGFGSSCSYTRHLIVFTRYPEPGKAKTRLIPALGNRGAAEFHCHMAEYTLQRIRAFKKKTPVSVEIRYDGACRETLERWLGADLIYLCQGGGTLGDRMARAFFEALQTRKKRVICVGTDCPGLKADHLHEAFSRLETNDLVLGPAGDGGYYLIGIRGKLYPELFQGVPWGTERVLARTREKAEKLNLSVGLLETLWDVDRPEDIRFWKQELEKQGMPPKPMGLSIIIPTYNEAEHVEKALESTTGTPGTIERIVVDGGSRDDTVKRAENWGARVVRSPSGKARQMNEGAREARGEGLVFLHADTRLPKGYGYYVRDILSRPGTVAGAFRLRVYGSNRGLRVIERLANFRTVRMHMPYGDQVFFFKTDRFIRAGGFPDISLMEDFELMRRLRRRGHIGIAPVSAVTSGRRYRKFGILKTTFLNQCIIAAYLAGVSPDRLAKWYHAGGMRPDPEDRVLSFD